jgi:hypothetical protein
MFIGMRSACEAKENISEGKTMNLFDAISTSNDLVTGHIASQIFSVLPEDGPGLAIIDRHGHRYTSEAELLAAQGITDETIKDLCSRVDDGCEPVITKAGETTVVASYLSTDRCNYGYAFILLKDYCPVAAMANIQLIETVLAQMNLVARLTESFVDRQSHAVSVSWATGCLN